MEENKNPKPKRTRKRGTGSVYYNNRRQQWVGQYRSFPKSPDDDYINIAVYGQTEDEVHQKLDAAIAAEKAKASASADMSVSELLRLWLSTRSDLKPKSYDRLEQTVDLVVRYIGEHSAHTLSSMDVSEMIATLKNEGRGYSTVKKARECVSACFEWAMDQEPEPLAKHNPARKVSIGTKDSYVSRKTSQAESDGDDDEDNDIRFYTPEQAAKIAKASLSTYKTGTPILFGGAIVIVMLNTGLRVGEMAGLKWTDIDFQKRLLFVRRNVVLIRNREAKDGEPKYHEIIQDSTKTSSGRRVIPLTDDAIAALNTLKERAPDSTFVSITQKGTRKSLRNIDRLCRSAEKMAGVPVYGCHALRHTFATLLLRSGNVDISTISKLLGHADISTTYNIYIHVIEQAKIEAMGELPSFLPDAEVFNNDMDASPEELE